jgi:hydroxymethylpyrimidine/phosphomethylpyrimidine kinase
MLEQGRRLIALGARRVLLKGGHLPENSAAADVFVSPRQEEVLSTPRLRTTSTHGTGCTLSSAIAALRTQRGSWLEAVVDAKQWLTAAIAAADVLEIGSGHGPVHHFHQLWHS